MLSTARCAMPAGGPASPEKDADEVTKDFHRIAVWSMLRRPAGDLLMSANVKMP